MPDPKLPETPPDPSDGGTWRERAEQAEGDRDALRCENERLRTQVDRLKRQLDAARRAGYRQAAPFAKPPKRDPQRPGRKAGPAYGRPAPGVGARMRAGLRASNRRARHLPMRYETGLPSSVIRFRT